MKWCPVPCPPGGLGGLAPQESPLITRALPPQRPCLAPVPCPPFFSSEFVRPNFFARMTRILMIFGPFEPRRRQRKFEKISNERKIIESIESIDSIERSRDRSDRSTAAVILEIIIAIRIFANRSAQGWAFACWALCL